MKLAILFLFLQISVLDFCYGEKLPPPGKISAALAELNKICESYGYEKFNSDSLKINILYQISEKINPLPANEWDGKMRIFVNNINNNVDQSNLPIRVLSTDENGMIFTDEKEGEEFVVQTPKYRKLIFRVYDPDTQGDRVSWIDLILRIEIVRVP